MDFIFCCKVKIIYKLRAFDKFFFLFLRKPLYIAFELKSAAFVGACPECFGTYYISGFGIFGSCLILVYMSFKPLFKIRSYARIERIVAASEHIDIVHKTTLLVAIKKYKEIVHYASAQHKKMPNKMHILNAL